MCAYHPEISYVTPLFLSYKVGKDNWDNHTCAFFAEREHFRLHMHRMVGQAFDQIYNALNKPELICVKDPHLTLLFPGGPRHLRRSCAEFMTVVRHPYDVVRSRQEVASKSNELFSINNAKAVAEKCVNCTDTSTIQRSATSCSIFVMRISCPMSCKVE